MANYKNVPVPKAPQSGPSIHGLAVTVETPRSPKTKGMKPSMKMPKNSGQVKP